MRLRCVAMRGREEGERNKKRRKEGRKVETVNMIVNVKMESCPLCQPAKHGKKVNVRSQ